MSAKPTAETGRTEGEKQACQKRKGDTWLRRLPASLRPFSKNHVAFQMANLIMCSASSPSSKTPLFLQDKFWTLNTVFVDKPNKALPASLTSTLTFHAAATLLKGATSPVHQEWTLA